MFMEIPTWRVRLIGEIDGEQVWRVSDSNLKAFIDTVIFNEFHHFEITREPTVTERFGDAHRAIHDRIEQKES
jgi:hypothetical protein